MILQAVSLVLCMISKVILKVSLIEKFFPVCKIRMAFEEVFSCFKASRWAVIWMHAFCPPQESVSLPYSSGSQQGVILPPGNI